MLEAFKPEMHSQLQVKKKKKSPEVPFIKECAGYTIKMYVKKEPKKLCTHRDSILFTNHWIIHLC